MVAVVAVAELQQGIAASPAFDNRDVPLGHASHQQQYVQIQLQRICDEAQKPIVQQAKEQQRLKDWHQIQAAQQQQQQAATGNAMGCAASAAEPPPAAAAAETPLDHDLLDDWLVQQCQDVLQTRPNEEPIPVYLESDVTCTHHAAGSRLSQVVMQRFGTAGLPDDTIHITLQGQAGQSLGAYLAAGITLELAGQAGDSAGKSLSGGLLVVRQDAAAAYCKSTSAADHGQVVGDLALYGGRSGQAFFAGRAGDRLCVRNAGVTAVVEGCGNYGCEEMSSGIAVVLGSVGSHFASGMTGGTAYVYDPKQRLLQLVAADVQECIFPLKSGADVKQLKQLLSKHVHLTGSSVARQLLRSWSHEQQHIIKIAPHESERSLQEAAILQRALQTCLQEKHLNSTTVVAGNIPAQRARKHAPFQIQEWQPVDQTVLTAAKRQTISSCSDCGDTPACLDNKSSCPIGVYDW